MASSVPSCWNEPFKNGASTDECGKRGRGHTIKRRLTFQSRVVTSLLFSLVLPLKCFKTTEFGGPLREAEPQCPAGMVQIRAVESPDLLAPKKKKNEKKIQWAPTSLKKPLMEGGEDQRGENNFPFRAYNDLGFMWFLRSLKK